jgi:hypothetical protein
MDPGGCWYNPGREYIYVYVSWGVVIQIEQIDKGRLP